MVDLPAGSPGDGLCTDAAGAVESGAYVCGVDEFKDAKFGAAAETLGDFADKYEDNKNAKRARQIAIAAEIAEERPEAGRRRAPTAPSTPASRMPTAPPARTAASTTRPATSTCPPANTTPSSSTPTKTRRT
ncbi:hypothetical protein [Streptomyces regalis]|uniref:Uncharacterized protein n=1 Tax=Streptomyces regalis TaxID=68262 RepID=A0A101JCG0_9ACTN|nr:hypothetical protein [Streptomyces regalis]KUL24224.1 hypothetical protein ADL12_37885 [Streptomyces regalis]